jgi:Mitochondrial carrier protein
MGLVSTAREIIEREGFRAFFQGLSPTLLKAGIGSAMTFFAHGYLTRKGKETQAEE